MTETFVVRWQVWLADSEPLIWRRFQVSNQISLDDLHQVLQRVMGWQGSHPHAFAMGGDRYAPPAVALANTRDSATVTLATLNLQSGSRLTYTYDFGDGWLHILTVEDILPAAATLPTPHCLEGARACPPENSGGIWGYEDLLERLEDPEDPDYEDLLDWLGDFDPEAFSPDIVNQHLQALR